MIEIFFKNLAKRLNNENDLSDITWTMAETSKQFCGLFLKFFFATFDNKSTINTFKREHSYEDSRPDFYISANGIEYIIECKKDDKKHHFEQYKNSFPAANFGYITNYKIKRAYEGFEIRTWHQFYDYLAENISLFSDTTERTFMQGYLNYLHQTCGLIKLQKMNLTNLTSLYYFNKLLQKILLSIEGYDIEIYNAAKSFDASRSGFCFTLKTNDSITIYPWVGIYYGGKTSIYFEINKNGCTKVFDSIDPNNAIAGRYYDAPDFDDEYTPSMIFYLKQEYFDKFNHCDTTLEEQEHLLQAFIKEVIDSIKLQSFSIVHD